MNYKNLCRTKAQKGNLEAVSSILNILREYSESKPNLTFNKMLFKLAVIGLNINDCYKETSQETLKRLIAMLKITESEE